MTLYECHHDGCTNHTNANQTPTGWEPAWVEVPEHGAFTFSVRWLCPEHPGVAHTHVMVHDCGQEFLCEDHPKGLPGLGGTMVTPLPAGKREPFERFRDGGCPRCLKALRSLMSEDMYQTTLRRQYPVSTPTEQTTLF